MTMTLLKTVGLVLGCCVGWTVLSVAVLDLLFWVDAPRAARKRQAGSARLHARLDPPLDAPRRA